MPSQSHQVKTICQSILFETFSYSFSLFIICSFLQVSISSSSTYVQAINPGIFPNNFSFSTWQIINQVTNKSFSYLFIVFKIQVSIYTLQSHFDSTYSISILFPVPDYIIIINLAVNPSLNLIFFLYKLSFPAKILRVSAGHK